MTGVTDAGGVNRFPSLVPGTYTVKVELPGFRTTRERVRVAVATLRKMGYATRSSK